MLKIALILHFQVMGQSRPFTAKRREGSLSLFVLQKEIFLSNATRCNLIHTGSERLWNIYQLATIKYVCEAFGEGGWQRGTTWVGEISTL
jgi:hypothetical protein